MMPTIILNRTSEFNNRLRAFQVFLDGKNIGEISNGKTKEFEVAPGAHNLSVKIDWASSPELSLDMQENEKMQVTVGGFKHGKWMMPLAGGIIALHFVLQIAFKINYVIWLVIPTFLLLMYYITFGRKKYLTIRRN